MNASTFKRRDWLVFTSSLGAGLALKGHSLRRAVRAGRPRWKAVIARAKIKLD